MVKPKSTSITTQFLFQSAQIGSSPIELEVEEVGEHILKVVPQGCVKKRTQTIKFTIKQETDI